MKMQKLAVLLLLITLTIIPILVVPVSAVNQTKQYNLSTWQTTKERLVLFTTNTTLYITVQGGDEQIICYINDDTIQNPITKTQANIGLINGSTAYHLDASPSNQLTIYFENPAMSLSSKTVTLTYDDGLDATPTSNSLFSEANLPVLAILGVLILVSVSAAFLKVKFSKKKPTTTPTTE
jgi:hypothetical protein